VVVEVLSDVAERFAPGSELLVGRPGAAGGSEAAVEGRLVVAAARGHRGDLLVRFEGLEDRGAAEQLQGALLEIEASAAAAPPEGEVFHYQLLGCRCRDRRGGDLGEVVDLIEDGGGLILLVEGAGRRVPVPFVASFLVAIDVGARNIELDLPPGLVETCAFES
jgi:16S rRNA processing protein RimM